MLDSVSEHALINFKNEIYILKTFTGPLQFLSTLGCSDLDLKSMSLFWHAEKLEQHDTMSYPNIPIISPNNGILLITIYLVVSGEEGLNGCFDPINDRRFKLCRWSLLSGSSQGVDQPTSSPERKSIKSPNIGEGSQDFNLIYSIKDKYFLCLLTVIMVM